MKLTVGRSSNVGGFALPTILLVSTVMLAILMAAVGATAASRVALDSQYYNQLAQQAVESGMNRANECLSGSGYVAQWSTKASGQDLRPDSDCLGATSGASPYVVGTAAGARVRTTYTIDAPANSGIGSSLKVIGTTQLVRASSPYTVWRTYDQVAYLQIETQRAIACPDGFVSVPGSVTYSTSDFCLGKYEAKNVGGRAGSQAANPPYTTISQSAAYAAAQLACDGCHLVTQAEWLTVAQNVLGVASNWSNGSVGSGYIYNGHVNGNPSSPLAASTDDTDGLNGMTGGTGNGSQYNNRRTLTLSNGEVIWDLAGNVWEWTDGTISSGQPGLSGGAWREWNTGGMTAGTFTPNSFPSNANAAASGWTSANGIGKLYSNSTDATLKGIERGGQMGNGVNAGIFTLNFNDIPTTANNTLGFRIAR